MELCAPQHALVTATISALQVGSAKQMEYREIAPGPAAARYIQNYWFLEDERPSEAIQRIVPDGRPAMILNFAQPFESQARGAWSAQPGCFFVGQITEPLLLRARGPARMLGINFRPHGARRILGMPVCELTNSVIRVEDISKCVALGLQKIRQSDAELLGCDALDAVFGESAATTKTDSQVVSRAVRQFERVGGQISVSEFARQAGLSLRQFQRLFRDAVGISPKLFCRMQRFQRVFRALEDMGTNWVGSAVECGYFDQAHLIRDFREFAGKPPTALLNEEIDLARHFLRTERMSHLSNTPATAGV